MAAPPLTFDGCFPPALPDSKIYKHKHVVADSICHQAQPQ